MRKKKALNSQSHDSTPNAITEQKSFQSSDNILKIFSTQETCKFLDVCNKTLQGYREDNLIPFSKVGRKFFYTLEDILQFLQNTKHPSYSQRLLTKNLNQNNGK